MRHGVGAEGRKRPALCSALTTTFKWELVSSLCEKRVKAGDYGAFEAIFRQHVSRVYRQAFKLIGNEAETEEVVQEVFLAVHQKVKTFRGESVFSTWLYRLTTNVALSRLRKRKRTKEVLLDDYLPRFQEDGHHEVRPVFNWGN